MAQDITQKQTNFVGRLNALVNQLNADRTAIAALLQEWSDSGYASGAPLVDGTSWVIPDAQVQAAVPAATAAMLNTAIGGLTAIKSAMDSNAGYLVPFKS